MKSFKNIGRKHRWPHKNPSKVGMCRAFLYYERTEDTPDRVVCAECGACFGNWSCDENPIERHLTAENGCFVTDLAKLSVAMKSDSMDRFDIQSACLSSYSDSSLNDISESLAAKGFYYMANKNSDDATVACVECLCFPQNGRDDPSHAAKCKLGLVVSQPVANESSSQKASLIVDGPESKSIRMRVNGTYDKIELSPVRFDLLYKILQTNTETFKQCVSRVIERQSKNDECSKTELINRVQAVVINMLEQTHAQQINLIKRVTESVISNLLEASNDDLISLESSL